MFQTEEEEEDFEKKTIRSIKKEKNIISNMKKKKTSYHETTKLEENSSQVEERFKQGCECQDFQCFDKLNPEIVYKHRLNIAELTKTEHDMYLMGLIRSCLCNPYETTKHTERQRQRAQYVYQGKKVCLEAFLYLENCTYYQIKRIRKHLNTHGVTPRVHGNQGKVPHNTFSLDTYQTATDFLKDFVKAQEIKQKTKGSKNSLLYLPADVTRKKLYNMYKEFCKSKSSDVKIIGYSTFRTFLNVQFSQLRFTKFEFAVRGQNIQNNSRNEVEKTVNENEELVPVVITNESPNELQTFILTPGNNVQTYKVTKSSVLIDKLGQPVTITEVSAI